MKKSIEYLKKGAWIVILSILLVWIFSNKGYIKSGKFGTYTVGLVALVALLYFIWMWWTVGKTVMITLILLGFGISWLVSYLMEMPYGSASYIGWVIWAMIIGKHYKNFVVFPDDNEGIILQNNFIRPIVNNLSSVGPTSTRGWRAIFVGFNLKWPWEVMIFKPIPLQKTIPLSGKVNCLSKDNKSVIITWVGSAKPMKDAKLVRYYTTEEAAFVGINQGLIDLEIQNITRDNELDKILAKSDEIYANICKKLYKGDNYSDSEIDSGRHVDTITATSVVADDATLRAKNATANVESVAVVIERLRKATAGDSVAFQMALALHFGQERPEVMQFLNVNKKGKSGGI